MTPPMMIAIAVLAIIVVAALAAGFAYAMVMLGNPRLPNATGWARYCPGEGVEITEDRQPCRGRAAQESSVSNS